MNRIKNTWTYRHIQLVVILGLVVGIGIESFGGLPAFPEAQAIEYKAEVTEHQDCDQKCLLNKWAHVRAQELYDENREMDLEKYRMEAIREGRDMLVNILDESDYVDYAELSARYGY